MKKITRSIKKKAHPSSTNAIKRQISMSACATTSSIFDLSGSAVFKYYAIEGGFERDSYAYNEDAFRIARDLNRAIEKSKR